MSTCRVLHVAAIKAPPQTNMYVCDCYFNALAYCSEVTVLLEYSHRKAAQAAITLPTSLKAASVLEAQRRAKEEASLILGGNDEANEDETKQTPEKAFNSARARSQSPSAGSVANASPTGPRPAPFKITKRQAEYLKDSFSARYSTSFSSC